MIKEHTNKDYSNSLMEIKNNILEMSAKVSNMFDLSIKAFIETDYEAAREIILMDPAVNQLEVDIDQVCLDVLARFQPVASDLRFVGLVLKMVADLERIGDITINICERTLKLEGVVYKKINKNILEMRDVISQMLQGAIDAFKDGDANLALNCIKQDEIIDNMYVDISHIIIKDMKKEKINISDGLHIHSIVKWLERLADHTTNMAEQIVFMLHGIDIRHSGKLPE